MSLPRFSLDTHALVWYYLGDIKLSHQAKNAIDKIFADQAECYLASILLLEIFHLSLRKRKFDFTKLVKSLRRRNIIFVPLDKAVLTVCYRLPVDLTIHDRIIVASAKINHCILVTKDPVIDNAQAVKTLW